jgi:hypothetical protein
MAELEAGVGIEQVLRVFQKLTTLQLPPYHQRRTASQLTNANRIRRFRRSVKHSALHTEHTPTTHRLLIHHAFTGTFTECDMRSLGQLFVMDTS